MSVGAEIGTKVGAGVGVSRLHLRLGLELRGCGAVARRHETWREEIRSCFPFQNLYVSGPQAGLSGNAARKTQEVPSVPDMLRSS